MTMDADQRARQLVEDELRRIAREQDGWTTRPGDTPDRVLYRLQSHARKVGAPWDEVFVHWWDLVRLGVVAIVGDRDGDGYYYDRLRVTPRGLRWLETKEVDPYGWERYEAATKRRVKSPDVIVMAYLREAAGALVAELFRASLITQGCACERLIVLLAQDVRDAQIVPHSDKLGKHLSASPPRGISVIFEEVRDALFAIAKDGSLPRELADAVDRRLTPVFEHARALRNKQGHPTGDPASAEDAEAALLLFPGFYEVVERLRQHLSRRTR